MKNKSNITMTRWQRSSKGNAFLKLLDAFIVTFETHGGWRYMIRRRRQAPEYSDLLASEEEAKREAELAIARFDKIMRD